MSIQARYFLIAVIIIGSIGIWLPIGIEALADKKVTFHSIPPNVTTYFVTILFAGCIDYFLGRIRALNINGIASIFLNLIILAIFSFGLVVGAVILNIYKRDGYSIVLGIIGVIISFRIWWLANVNNPNFDSTSAALGGDATKPLTNG